jgi:hypothetical protein
LAKKAGPKKSDPFLSLLLLFILLAKRVKNIKFSLPSQQHFLLSCFLSSLVIKRKRTHIKRERERESAADAWKRRKSFAFGHK